MRVRWHPDPPLRLDEGVRRRVEEQLRRLDPSSLRGLGEYEETGDAVLLPEPDPLEGLYVKVVRRGGRLELVAGLWEHGGYVEECCVGGVEEG